MSKKLHSLKILLGFVLIGHLSIATAMAGTASSIPYNEGFESDGNNSRYLLSSQFFDLLNGIFDQTTNLTHGNDGPYTGQIGSGIFASEDTDDAAGTQADEQTITFNLNVAGHSNLVFDALFAAGALSTFDIDDYIKVESQIDSGEIEPLLHFQSTDAVIGSRPMAHDDDQDGVGEGAELGFEFQRFSAPILNVGSFMVLIIRINADSGFESLAIDDINITSSPAEGDTVTDVVVSPDGTANVSSTGASGRTYRIESTDSLTPATWVYRATVTADNSGDVQYTDPGPVPPYRVYRTVYP